MKKTIYILFLAITTAVGLVSCNDEWEDEQFVQMASFRAESNDLGVTSTYLRYNPEGKVRFNLPLVISGSTPNTKNRIIHIGLDPDTLARLNQEEYGHRQELYFRQLDSKYYSMPETIEVPAGASTVTIPIDFTLGDLDQVDKWVLPLQILDDPSYDYKANPHKQYRRAMLHITPFNDYSGEYGGTLYKVFLDGNLDEPLTLNSHRAFVVDNKTIFLYAGIRNIEYLDRKNYKVFVKFTDDQIVLGKKKLEIWSDNAANNKFKIGANQSYYTKNEEWDAKRPYLKHIYITMFLSYEFEDYTTIPGQRLKYKVEGTLSMQRDLNTLIPDEDQQIQW
ncbi:DUF4973 domain-containing protein [Pararcticibacter amylolyticus]|uniref:DUF4973 domain-containing protein n=1 Tax=Pararcticibacter amylolyticus TaxID=2173175 RepID=A0A2U2PEA9_9SPHI|nr:DUF4973 domain-containing protein [Pararcticibacter amylolyticus]PWG79459.1 hypothetical protein DDR33_17020 [Pararcticibacter amylolyticus]